MRLLTNNPSKRAGLEGYGLSIVERVPLETEPTTHNLRYLQTKREKLGHLLDGLDEDREAVDPRPRLVEATDRSADREDVRP